MSNVLQAIGRNYLRRLQHRQHNQLKVKGTFFIRKFRISLTAANKETPNSTKPIQKEMRNKSNNTNKRFSSIRNNNAEAYQVLAQPFAGRQSLRSTLLYAKSAMDLRLNFCVRAELSRAPFIVPLCNYDGIQATVGKKVR